jgi:methionyl-tRNA synthetase
MNDAPVDKATIEYSTFEQLDLRVGKVVDAIAPEWSEKLLQFTVDFGPEVGERTILSGVKAWYSPADFIGNHYPFVINLAERKMGQAVSQGMMIMADTAERPVIIPIENGVPAGSVIR